MHGFIYGGAKRARHVGLLGIADDKVVVLCKDFAVHSQLIEFSKIKTTSVRDLQHSEDSDATDGSGTNLESTLDVIRHSGFFEGLPAEEFFWKMFIIDYLIDNPDRNNGNWGILVENGKRSLAPVYDCGNSLESKWDDDKCLKALQDNDLMEDTVWRRKICFFTDCNGKRIKPYYLIKSKEYPICEMVLQKILMCKEEPIYEFINQCEFLTSVRKEFYCETIRRRFEKLR